MGSDYKALVNADITEVKFDTDVWMTPNTYDTNFKPFPPKPGVYFILHCQLWEHYEEILYIGCAKNLQRRLAGHEVRRMLNEFYDYLPVFFLEHEQYRELEKHLIQKYRPRFNKQFNGKAVHRH